MNQMAKMGDQNPECAPTIQNKTLT